MELQGVEVAIDSKIHLISEENRYLHVLPCQTFRRRAMNFISAPLERASNVDIDSRFLLIATMILLYATVLFR